jgi:hypothetical protein
MTDILAAVSNGKFSQLDVNLGTISGWGRLAVAAACEDGGQVVCDGARISGLRPRDI